MSHQKEDWTKKAEKFAKIRENIKHILGTFPKPLDMAQIATDFKLRYRYLPTLERRMRELVNSGAVIKNEGRIPTFELRRRVEG